MCSIIGFEKRNVCAKNVQACFDKTRSRGPDMTRFEEVGDGWLGFHRLAIMGLSAEGMQPFHRAGNALVCNGEIYGFRPIKTELIAMGYKFQSGSDCEILLPMYYEYGVDMFPMLDAEFALILYDEKDGGLVAARDPLGIRPLFYGRLDDGSAAFASEAKNLVGLCEHIMPFPPGCYWKNGVFTRYADVTSVEKPCHDSEETASRNIRSLLVQGIEKRLDSDAPLGFLLSGGLDSSIVCAVAARIFQKPIRTFAIGMDKDAIDLKYARIAAEHIGAQHTEVIMTRSEVIENLETVIAALGTYDITTIRASIGMYLCCKYIHEKTDIRVLMTGEISDELFGYKYTDFAPSPQEFQRESKKRVDELYMYDVLRADHCISVNSLEPRVPFGDIFFAKYVMSLCPEVKMNTHGKGKYLLRRAFEEGDWLPPEILWREKAAFSDAVGHSMVDDLKEYAEKMYSDGKFVEKCKEYDHARPFTKESLLYREIFEKYYPGQSKMVSDFWMPNKDWPGCNVNDPSARILANYGSSGE